MFSFFFRTGIFSSIFPIGVPSLYPVCPGGALKIREPQGLKTHRHVSKAPASTQRQAPWGSLKPGASKRVTTHFCGVSLFHPLPPPRLQPCFRSAIRPPCLCEALRRAPPQKTRFFSSSRVFKALPPGASPGLLNASRVSQTNRANSRRTLQTFRNASSPQGIQGGGRTL